MLWRLLRDNVNCLVLFFQLCALTAVGPEFVSGLGSAGVQMALTAHHAAVSRWEVCEEGLYVSSWSWGSLE